MAHFDTLDHTAVCGPLPSRADRAMKARMASSGVVDRLQQVRERLEQAAKRSGRNPDSITLVAVSKRKPAEMIQEAYEAGQRDFGENYVQEWAEKAEQLRDSCPEIRWHIIGPLQSNKVKYVVGKVQMIQTVDRLKIAQKIAQRSQQMGIVQRVLLEVNVGGESSKSGVAVEEVPGMVEQLVGMEGIRLEGLMTIPPAGESEQVTRERFRTMKRLAEGLPIEQPILSMGMTADMELAIEEGATMVRVGTAIFGPR